MPLVKEGRLTALMAIHDKAPRRWTPEELAMIREVTERSWAHIERVRAEAELRASAGALSELNATLEQRVQEERRSGARGRGRAAPGAEDGGGRPADRRHRRTTSTTCWP